MTNEGRQPLMSVDMGAVDLRRGVVGALGILVTIVFVGLLGPAGLLAGLAALFLGVLDTPGPLSRRLAERAAFVAIGATVVALLSWAGTDTWSATLAAAAITYLGTLAAAWGASRGAEGQALVLITVVTLMVAGGDLSPWGLAAAFVAGGAIATAVWFLGRGWVDDDDVDPIASTGPDDDPLPPPTVSAAVRSPVGVFAALRASAVGIATVSGYGLFETHPVWALLTVVLVVQTPAQQTIQTGVERTAGTLVGVVAAIAVTNLIGDSTGAVVVAFVVSAAGMMAFKEASYALSTMFTTAMLLFSQRILQEDAYSTGWERLEATILGTVIAFVIIGVAMSIDRRRGDSVPSSGETAAAD